MEIQTKFRAYLEGCTKTTVTLNQDENTINVPFTLTFFFKDGADVQVAGNYKETFLD